MTRIVHLADHDADAIVAILRDGAMEDAAIDGLDDRFAAALADAKATKDERLETWLGGRHHSHVASVNRETEPDGDGTYTTLRLVIGPELRVSQINEVLTGMRRHALDFVRTYGGRD